MSDSGPPSSSSTSHYYYYYDTQPIAPNSYPRTPIPTPSSSASYYISSSPSYQRQSSHQSSPTTHTYYYSYSSPPIPLAPIPISYLCLIPTCTYAAARKADLERHYAAMHPPPGDSQRKLDCRVEGCARKGKYGFRRKDKMVEHLREVHGWDLPKKDRRRGG